MATNQGFKSFIPKSDVAHSPYLYHWLRANRGYLESLGNGATFKEVSKAVVSRVEVPLPPIEEQRRLAAILDQAEALRAQRRAAIAQLDSLGQAIFVEMFGDVVFNSKLWPADAQLGDIADIASGVTKGRKLSAAPTRSVPYLAVANVQDKALLLDPVKTIDATAAEIERYRLRRDDLLLTEGGDPDKLGRGTLWREELPEAIHQNHIFRVRIQSREFHPLFLNWLVGSERGKRYFLKSAKQTTGIASINMTQLRAFPLLRPPLSLQERFAERMSAVDKHRAHLCKAQAELDTLLASLQHRAFRGELTRRASTLEDLQKLEAEAGLEALIFVAKRTAKHDLYVIGKTLYMADKHHLEQHGRLIYGETHEALPMGPVPKAAYDTVKFLRGEQLFSSFDEASARAAIRVEGNRLVPLRDADLAKLGADAVKSLEWAIRYMDGATFEQAKAATHDAAWQRTPPNGAIALEHIFELLPAQARQRHWGL